MSPNVNKTKHKCHKACHCKYRNKSRWWRNISKSTCKHCYFIIEYVSIVWRLPIPTFHGPFILH